MNISNLALQIQGLSKQSLWDGADIALEMGVTAATFYGLPKPYTPGEPTVYVLWDEFDNATRRAVRKLREKFERAVIHAPFLDTPLVSTNPYIERESHRQLLMSIRTAGALDLETVTVHAGLPVGMTQDEFDRRLIEVLQMFGEEAERVGTRIGLENWRYPASPEDHIRLLETVNHPAVGATLDVGHVCYWLQNEGITGITDDAGVADYHQRLWAIIERIGPYINHVHLHDVLPNPLQDHQALGRGFLDFGAIVAQLDQFDFDGLMLFEVGGGDAQQIQAESVKRMVAAMNLTEETIPA